MESKNLEYLNNEQIQNEIEQGKLYILLNKNEKASIPIDPNLLNFYDHEAEKHYTKHLFLDKSQKQLSDDIFSKLLIFFLYLTLTCICFLAFAVIAYNRGQLSESLLIFHILFNVFTPICSGFSLLLIRLPQVFIRVFKAVIAGIALIYYTYLVLCNRYVLSAIFGSDSADFGMPFGVVLIGFSGVMRFVLNHSFFYLLLINLTMLLEYIITTMAVRDSYTMENFSQFFCLLIFMVLQIIDARNSEFILRRDFWLQFQYERSFRISIQNKTEDNSLGLKTENEKIIFTCDEIKKTLKYCCSVIIFKDIKDSLKLAQIQLESIKQKIGRSSSLAEVKIEQEADIDPDDKKFISQNFIDFSHINTPERSAVSEVTVFEFKEVTTNFPFSHYGIDKLESVLSQIGKNWSFDIWFIHNATGQSISIIGKYLFRKWQLNEFLSQDPSCSDEFFIKIEAGYGKNPYHNACHAADVLHTQLFFITQSSLSKTLTQLDIVSCIIASLGHDIGHPAVTNRFLVNNCDDIAITYNDSSVLENMHSAKTFAILKTPGFNILENITNDDWLKCRRMIIEMILETDMSKHFEILGKFRTRVFTLSNLDIAVFDDKCQALGMALKCADIGHSAKDYDLHEKWSILVCEEFFKQGDIEKSRGQVVSMYCDRQTTDIPKSQAGFIKNICIPLYEVWTAFLKSETVEKFALGQLKRNLEFWSSKKKRRSTVKLDDFRMVEERLKRIQTSI